MVGYVNLVFQVLVELHGDENPCNYICNMVSESVHDRSSTAEEWGDHKWPVQ